MNGEYLVNILYESSNGDHVGISIGPVVDTAIRLPRANPAGRPSYLDTVPPRDMFFDDLFSVEVQARINGDTECRDSTTFEVPRRVLIAMQPNLGELRDRGAEATEVVACLGDVLTAELDYMGIPLDFDEEFPGGVGRFDDDAYIGGTLGLDEEFPGGVGGSDEELGIHPLTMRNLKDLLGSSQKFK